MTRQSRLHRFGDARTSFAERLEQVRWEHSCTTLREFVQALNELEGVNISYSAALTYHRHREPSASYLAAVVERFGVDATWLLTGK